MGGRGSSSSGKGANAAKKERLIEYANSLKSKSFLSAADADRAALAEVAADMVGTSTLTALNRSNLTEGIENTFRRNDVPMSRGVSTRISSLSGSDARFVRERMALISRETGASTNQIDAYIAYKAAL